MNNWDVHFRHKITVCNNMLESYSRCFIIKTTMLFEWAPSWQSVVEVIPLVIQSFVQSHPHQSWQKAGFNDLFKDIWKRCTFTWRRRRRFQHYSLRLITQKVILHFGQYLIPNFTYAGRSSGWCHENKQWVKSTKYHEPQHFEKCKNP